MSAPRQCIACGQGNPPVSRFCGGCGEPLLVPKPEEASTGIITANTVLGRKYQVLDEIGRGGMGIVYRGTDLSLHREVAIKVLPTQFNDDPRIIGRFKREARAMAALDHPNIVPIYSIGRQGALHYFVMKFLPGVTVGQMLAERDGFAVRFTQADVQRILLGACRGLHHAHERRLVHRDIKPSNIMLGPDGHVTVMDFGIVKAEVGDNLTRHGQLFGTPEYLAPEHAHGKARATPATDIYALGVVAYEMLTGRPPFIAKNHFEVMKKHLHEQPAPLVGRIDGVSPSMEQIIFKALAKWPAERYETAADMAATLETLMPDERRTEHRIRINKEFSGLDELVNEYASDISTSGCFIRSHHPLEVGTMVNLRFTLLDSDMALIEGYGQVVRTVHQGENQGMGIRFVALTKDSRRHVERLVATGT